MLYRLTIDSFAYELRRVWTWRPVLLPQSDCDNWMSSSLPHIYVSSFTHGILKDTSKMLRVFVLVGLLWFSRAHTLSGRRRTERLQHFNCVCYCSHRNMPVTFQALSERERKLWMEAMDGKEPVSSFFICTRFCFSSLTEGLAQTHTFNFQTPLLNPKF